jgi:hypothetical protein
MTISGSPIVSTRSDPQLQWAVLSRGDAECPDILVSPAHYQLAQRTPAFWCGSRCLEHLMGLIEPQFSDAPGHHATTKQTA